jgi:hypothetical protein
LREQAAVKDAGFLLGIVHFASLRTSRSPRFARQIDARLMPAHRVGA